MKKVLSILVVFSLIYFIFCQKTFSNPSQKYLFKVLDLLVERTLEAYNSENHVKFYEYFAESMDSVTSREHFEGLFIEGYKNNLGDVEPKRILLVTESMLSAKYS